MVSREHKRAALHEKLQLLRSLTNSHAKKETCANHLPFILDMMCMNQGESVDAQVVKEAVLHAVRSFHGSSDEA
ncbi:hypothetical protein BHE74_00038589 [Ensete ventricosum]|nr:hypothetical protein BHE74_00038589 [Ensete ventricosum]RZR95284.1 hypothetical protein BHM03_00024110 [Ensete ventricosum]